MTAAMSATTERLAERPAERLAEREIYLDHMATTPCAPAVVDAMLPYLTTHFGNAGSRAHAFGWTAEAAVKQARAQVAALIGATPREIVFTSGATESNNLGIKGAAQAAMGAGRHVITQVSEHKAALAPFAVLEKYGWTVTRLAVDEFGRVDPAAVEAAIRPDTTLVSIQHANNEIGTLQPIAAIGAICRARDVLLHTDAAQTVGKIPVDVAALNVDLLSLSAHKFYGPKGIGALYIRRRRPRIAVTAQQHGGDQERGLRPGTLPVHQIVGLGTAALLAQADLVAEAARQAGLRDRLRDLLVEGIPNLRLNGHPEARLPGNLHVSIGFIEGAGLLTALRPLALSSGSACMSEALKPSHVLGAIGLDAEWIHGSLRFGLGRSTTTEDVDHAAARVISTIQRIRARA
ncbi:MAG: cysteine desulfurase [Bradymonadia bacterium]|jgi:cysteine desulfurase